MRLQYNPHLFKAHLPLLVNRVKGISKRLLTVEATVALATRTCFPVFIGLSTRVADLYEEPLDRFGADAVERWFTEKEVDELIEFTEQLAA